MKLGYLLLEPMFRMETNKAVGGKVNAWCTSMGALLRFHTQRSCYDYSAPFPQLFNRNVNDITCWFYSTYLTLYSLLLLWTATHFTWKDTSVPAVTGGRTFNVAEEYSTKENRFFMKKLELSDIITCFL